MVGERASSDGWARYSTEQLELLLARMPTERGVPLPSVLAELRAEVERRHDANGQPGAHDV
jgi:hypothetical protein